MTPRLSCGFWNGLECSQVSSANWISEKINYSLDDSIFNLASHDFPNYWRTLSIKKGEKKENKNPPALS